VVTSIDRLERASPPIASDAEIKTVQARMRHALAKTTLDSTATGICGPTGTSPLGLRRWFLKIIRILG
jgi:hypothetical protein